MSDLEYDNYDYDEFMASDDEEMQMSDIEFESDEEVNIATNVPFIANKPIDSKGSAPHLSDEESHIRSLYDSGNNYIDNQEWQMARTQFNKIVKIDNDSIHTFEYCLEIYLKIFYCWSQELLYYEFNNNDNDINNIIIDNKFEINALNNDCEEFCKFIHNCNDSNSIDATRTVYSMNTYESLIKMINDLLPIITRDFLFNIDTLTNDEIYSIKERINLHLTMCDNFKPLLSIYRKENDMINTLITFKTKVTKQYELIFHNGESMVNREIFKYLLKKFTTSQNINLKSIETDITIRRLNILLQCFIYNYLNSGEKLFIDEMNIQLTELEKLLNESLLLSQNSGIMFLYHFSMAIIKLPPPISRQYDDSLFTNHIKEITSCKEHFLQGLKYCEENGSLSAISNLNNNPIDSKYFKYILCGFAFSSIITVLFLKKYKRESTERINPFDYEQVKIIKLDPLIILLEKIYYEIINELDLSKGYEYVQMIPNEIEILLHELVESIFQLGQSLKLWTQIATVYSCISIKDLQSKLSFERKIHLVTRDDIITMLMKSTLRNTVQVYFKIDFTTDIIWFGEEYRGAITNYPETSFNLYKEDENKRNQEYTNDIGIYNVSPFPNLQNIRTVNDFFTELRGTRENRRTITSRAKRDTTHREHSQWTELLQIIQQEQQEQEHE